MILLKAQLFCWALPLPSTAVTFSHQLRSYLSFKAFENKLNAYGEKYYLLLRTALENKKQVKYVIIDVAFWLKVAYDVV